MPLHQRSQPMLVAITFLIAAVLFSFAYWLGRNAALLPLVGVFVVLSITGFVRWRRRPVP